MRKILVSRCLRGDACRYHGQSVTPYGSPVGRPALLRQLSQKYLLTYVCPEVESGMPTPRDPIRIRDGRAIWQGRDITPQLEAEAARILADCQRQGIMEFYGLWGSPSCGPGGIVFEYLRRHGMLVKSTAAPSKAALARREMRKS